MFDNKPLDLSIKKKFTCKKCKRSYKKNAWYIKHTSSCPKLFKCHICDRIFKYKLGLKYHLLSHTHIVYNCLLCNKTHDTIYKLHYHMKKCCYI
jgi:hypothetical protein